MAIFRSLRKLSGVVEHLERLEHPRLPGTPLIGSKHANLLHPTTQLLRSVNGPRIVVCPVGLGGGVASQHFHPTASDSAVEDIAGDLQPLRIHCSL